nr:NUDIX domain-containing protein [Jiangella alkaliphila]
MPEPEVTRIDYLDDPAAPAANRLVPSANVVVANERGEILLIRRTDNGNWTLPRGAMDVGERFGYGLFLHSGATDFPVFTVECPLTITIDGEQAWTGEPLAIEAEELVVCIPGGDLHLCL